MGKSEWQKISYIEDRNDDEKEIYLKELGKSVHSYIKTGVRNTQLEDLIELEEEFQKKYEERFNVRKIAELISQSSIERISQIEKTYWLKLEKKSDDTICEENKRQIDVKKVSDHIAEVVVEVAYNKLQNVIKDTAYLSHMNMLYELYEQEERLRRKEEEYEKISEKFQKMADITRSLSQERRMKIEQLQEQTDISEKELESLLNMYEKYFNIRKKKESIQISLSPAGKKYYDYIMNSKQKYSKKTLEQIVYKNCDRLMESLETSYDRGLEFNLKLEEISPEKDRALQTKYHKLMQKFISENEEVYTAKGYIINEEKESVYRNNEKNRIRIPREWD